MSFESPIVVAFAVVAAIGIGWLLRFMEKRRTGNAFAYSSLTFAAESLHAPKWPAAMLFSAFVTGTLAIGVALAGPHLVAPVPVAGGSVMLCIDTSGSMRAQDLQPTRSDAARAAARAFVDAVPKGTRVGIASFSFAAQVVVPATADLDAVREAIDRIPAPDGATAMGDCLALAQQSLPARGRRAIVLMTDGVNNRGLDPLDVSRRAGELGITIETVGVGTAGSGEVIPGTSELADLDESALQQIAENGHGHYVAATDAASLAQAFEALARETVWKKERVDVSLPSALFGGILLLAALVGGVAAGRFP